MIDVKAVWEELKVTLPLALFVVALTAVLTDSSWPETLALAGSMLLFVIIWDASRVLWRKQRERHRSA